MNKSSLALKLTSMLDAPESVKNEVFSLLIKKLVQRLQPGDSIILSDLGTFHFKKVIIKKPYSTDVNISSSINVIGYELNNDKFLLYEFPSSVEMDDEFINDLAHLMNQSGSAAGSFDIETAKMYIQTYEEIVDDIIKSGQLNKNKVIGSEFLIISREDFEKSLQGKNEDSISEPPSVNPKSSFADFLNESMDEEFSDIDMEEEVQDTSKDDPFNKVIDDVELSFDEYDFEKVSPFEVDEKTAKNENYFKNSSLNISEKPDFNVPFEETNEMEEIEIPADEFEIQPEVSADLEQAEPVIENNDITLSSTDEAIEKDINNRQEVLEKDYKKRKSNALFYTVAGILAIAAIGLFIYYQLGYKLIGNKSDANDGIVKTTEINRNDQIPVTIEEQNQKLEDNSSAIDSIPSADQRIEEKKVETPQNNIIKEEVAAKPEVKTPAKIENKAAVSKTPVQNKTVASTASVKKPIIKKPVNQEPTFDSRVSTKRSDGFEQVSSWQDLNKASNQVVTERSKGYESKIEVIEIAGKGTWYRVLRRKL